jgi:hypothetical protein
MWYRKVSVSLAAISLLLVVGAASAFAVSVSMPFNLPGTDSLSLRIYGTAYGVPIIGSVDFDNTQSTTLSGTTTAHLEVGFSETTHAATLTGITFDPAGPLPENLGNPAGPELSATTMNFTLIDAGIFGKGGVKVENLKSTFRTPSPPGTVEATSGTTWNFPVPPHQMVINNGTITATGLLAGQMPTQNLGTTPQAATLAGDPGSLVVHNPASSSVPGTYSYSVDMVVPIVFSGAQISTAPEGHASGTDAFIDGSGAVHATATFTHTFVATPEPGSIVMLVGGGLALLAMLLARRRRP